MMVVFVRSAFAHAGRPLDDEERSWSLDDVSLPLLAVLHLAVVACGLSHRPNSSRTVRLSKSSPTCADCDRMLTKVPSIFSA